MNSNHCKILLGIQTHLELSGLSSNRCEAAVTDFSSIMAEDGKKQQPSRWNRERLAFFFVGPFAVSSATEWTKKNPLGII
jgi:hypothetical protein